MLRLTSSHWGAYRASAAHGRIEQVVPFERDPDPSPILRGVADAFDHPTRIRRPAVRLGWLRKGRGEPSANRGVDPFVEVSWEQALDFVAAELSRVRRDHGNQAIFGGSYGWSSAGRFHHAKTQLKRFLNGFGGFVDQVNNYSYGAGMVILPHVVGDNTMLHGPATDWRAIADNANLVVAFGGFPAKNAQVEAGGCGEHVLGNWLDRIAQRKVKLVNVSPIRGDIPEGVAADWWPLAPSTDTALILGLCRTLLEENLLDRAFLKTYTTGFEKFAHYLRHGRNGGPAPAAEWASELTGIPAGRIRALARSMASGRTFIAMSWSLQRADHGEQPYWAAVALACMLGQIGLPGGGVGFGYASVNGHGNAVSKVKSPVLPVGANEVSVTIPVARIADLFLRPGEPLRYNGQEITLPDTRLVYWCGGNPFHHHQDLNRLVRAWQRPETIIIHESWWTATARRADIVLPATTTLERNDLGASSGDRYLIAMKQIAPSFAESRNDHDIFTALAQRLGFKDTFTENVGEAQWLERMYSVTRASASRYGIDMPGFDAFWEQGYFEYPQTRKEFNSLDRFRADPEQNRLGTPSGRIEIFSAKVDSFGSADCLGHPAWFEPGEWLGAKTAKQFPLHLISNQPRTRLHGQMDPVGPSRDSKVQGREPLVMNPFDAAVRGLCDQQVVRVFNDRGACLAGLRISSDVRPGVIQLATGAWFDPLVPGEPGSLEVHGNPNVLTHDLGTSSLSQGPSAQSVLVEVEAFEGPVPPITVHSAPAFVNLESSVQ